MQVHSRKRRPAQLGSWDVEQDPKAFSPRKKRTGLVALRRKAIFGIAPTGPEQRRHMIELAAYYRAERRGFAPGGELQDWLDAEREIASNASLEKINGSR